MNLICAALLFSCLHLAAGPDLDSGPARSTIQNLSWGTLYFEPLSGGPCKLESTSAGFRFSSGQGLVQISGSEYNGLRLAWERETLSITHLNGVRGIEVRTGERTWNLHLWYGRLTLTSTDPRDTVVFERNGNTFTIKGAQGTITLTNEWGNLKIKSPLGVTSILSQQGKRTFTGPALDQIPYLGRGLFIPFHGVGVFVDITRYFPMAELVEWLEWRPLNFE